MQKIVILVTLSLYFLSNQCIETTNSIKNAAQTIAIQTHNAPQAIGPYSQAIKVINGQEVLFISGQLPIIPETGELISEPTEATKQCMYNIDAILKEAGMDFSHVVETTILLANIADFPAVNNAYASFLKEPYPARVTFQVGALPKNASVEIKMTAIR